jgi:hypothetical protein
MGRKRRDEKEMDSEQKQKERDGEREEEKREKTGSKRWTRQRRDVQREREIRCTRRELFLYLAADLGVSATDGVKGVGGVAAPE